MIELFHDRGCIIDCDMRFLSNIVDHMDGPFGRTEALNNDLTADLISYLFENMTANILSNLLILMAYFH